LRWHQGIIEKVWTDQTGRKRYNGRHTKGVADGKWITYGGYSETFENYTIGEFRMPPNVFDIIDNSEEEDEEDEEEGTDVYVSYVKTNSPQAIKNQEVNAPPSYEQVMLDTMCDPRDIIASLKSKGVKICEIDREAEGDAAFMKIATTLKRTKVFIACVSDEYANDETCRMEFQYAKKTLGLPVIPIVVGSGSFEWQLTVVGLLVAGDLYIHFKNKEVEESKMTELTVAIQAKIPDIVITGVEHKAVQGVVDLHTAPGVNISGGRQVKEEAKIFFSYCWTNSKDAIERKQIPFCVGNEWNDPRRIVKKIAESTGMATWLDIERLGGAASLQMFDQIATAIKHAKVIVACVSEQYAVSENCKMEFQFAATSLKKTSHHCHCGYWTILGGDDCWIQDA